MKTPIKIVIIASAVILVIVSIVFFLLTRVQSLRLPKPIDQYAKDLSQSFDSFKTDSLSTIQADSILLATANRIDIFEKEEKLTTQTADKKRDELVSSYAPVFLKDCFAEFNKSTWWDENKLKTMPNRVYMLNNIKHSDGTSAVRKTIKDSLKIVETVAADYFKAKAISSRASYRGIDDAKRTINLAAQYRTTTYLSNCTDLVNALAEVKTRIGNAHYRYVESYVERLVNWQQYSSWDSYKENVNEVNSVILEFKNNVEIYGTKFDVDGLIEKAQNYVNKANRNLEDIRY